MRRVYWCLFSIFLVLTLGWTTTVAADTGWQRINVPVRLGNGEARFVEHPRFNEPREIKPQCSGGPTASSPEFSFFVHEGLMTDRLMTDRLLIFFDGGGACWDKNTCLLSPFLPQPTYEQEVTEKFDVEGAPLPGGILDLENPANPFYGWTMVFIPYCTGDIHWGSNDAEYTLPPIPGLLPNGLTRTIHHRGFDNFLAVLDTLKDQLPRMNQVAVAGSSAGAYGAISTFPFIKDLLHWKTRTYLIPDAGSGVINQEFVENALKNQWKVAQNLATWIPGIATSLLNRPNAAKILEVALVTSIARFYPLTRIAQYTTAWDAVQTQFLKIMDNPDNPDEWSFNFDPANEKEFKETVAYFCEWSARAQIQTYVSALARNYRFYIGAGTNHTALPSNEPLGGLGSIYTENSAQGVPMVDWVDAMLDNGTSASGVAWDNVRCSFGQCAPPPFPPVLCLGQ